MSALILMYHDISENLDLIDPEHRPYVLEPTTFRLQMACVASTGFPVITVTQWCSLPRPPHALTLTFDDGHVSNYNFALPILLEYGLKATFFITAGLIGVGETMSWGQIRDLHKASMEIGSHTLTHRPPSTLDDRELRYELAESRRILEDGIGAPVTSLSSPTGFFNPRMCAIAREVGYRALCFGRFGMVHDGGDPFSLNRIAVKRSVRDDQFASLLRFNRGAISRLRLRQWVRELARETLGVESYVRLRRLLIRTSSS